MLDTGNKHFLVEHFYSDPFWYPEPLVPLSRVGLGHEEQVSLGTKNMFSPDVKRLCFRCQTLKFPRPNLSLHDLKRLFFRFQTLKFSHPNAKFSRQSWCSRGSLSSLSSQSRYLRKTCKNYQYGEAKSIEDYIWVGKLPSLTPET